MNVPIFKLEKNFGLIKLDSAKRHNALRLKDIDEILRILDYWQQRDDLRTLIFTGTGKSFCSGLFIRELEKKDWRENPVKKLCDAIESFPSVTICALNGSAYGAGVELAASCDFRVAHRKISIGIPAASLGIHYEPSGIKRVLNLFGPNATRKIFLLNEKLNYDCLKETSFVDFWTDEPESVFRCAKDLTNRTSNLAPLAIRGMKRSIVDILRGKENMIDAIDRFSESLASIDHLEALLALKKKRKPRFNGQ